jgi:hypothetical protein
MPANLNSDLQKFMSAGTWATYMMEYMITFNYLFHDFFKLNYPLYASVSLFEQATIMN